MKKLWLGLCVFVVAALALAVDVSVIWDPVPEGTVESYTISVERHTVRDGRTIYISVQPPITIPVTQTNVTNVTIKNLTAGVWYSLTIVASNRIGKSPVVELSQIPTNFLQKQTTIFQIKTNK